MIKDEGKKCNSTLKYFPHTQTELRKKNHLLTDHILGAFPRGSLKISREFPRQWSLQRQDPRGHSSNNHFRTMCSLGPPASLLILTRNIVRLKVRDEEPNHPSPGHHHSASLPARARAGRQRLAISFSAQSTKDWPELSSPLKSDPQNVGPPPPFFSLGYHPTCPAD